MTEVQLQYAGYNTKKISLYLLAFRYQLAVIKQNPILGILEIFHIFEVSVESPQVSLPIQIRSIGDDRPLWISRQSFLDGIFSTNLSSEIEWNRIRFSRHYSNFIWSKPESKFSHKKEKLNPISGNRGFEIVDSLEIVEHSSNDLSYLQLRHCLVISALYCISETAIYYLDKSTVSDEISWPTNLIFTNFKGKSLLIRSSTSDKVIEHAALMGSSSSWFHFLVEILPRYLRAREISGSDFQNRELLIRGELPKSILEIINLLNFKNVTNIFDGEIVSVVDLFMVTENRFSSVTDMRERHSDLKLVREFLLGHNSTFRNFDKIYLKRAKNLFRPLSNRRRMEIRLAQLGFTTIDLEILTAFEQIAIFQSAKIVVAESGAALTNILFMNPNSTVLEIHPGNDKAGLWGSLADILGVRLEVIYGQQNRIRNIFFGLGSYRLSIKKLSRRLLKLIEEYQVH